MEWEQLTVHIRELKDTFDKSYKCISQNRPIHVGSGGLITRHTRSGLSYMATLNQFAI